MKEASTIFVGLSGGVDSSVAALRLIKEGYNVVGVFIKVWQPDFLECAWEEERLDAMRVAAKLNIPFLTCDAEQAYKDDVADYFIAEYKDGRTPNPDVMCNKYVKFGAFLRFATKHGADFIATGHYAQRIEKDGIFELHRGVDTTKDQSYFLWTLTQEQLSQTLFPVGNSSKKQIRKEASEAGLLTAEKKDSQGICFLGQIDIPEFLSHYIKLENGNVLNETGEVIGEHGGALVYTTGQRHGFVVTSHNTHREVLYVVARNIETNTITVSPERVQTHQSEHICIDELNLIGDPAESLQMFELQIRYRQNPITCKAVAFTDLSMELMLLEETEKPSLGQSCVLYDGMRCLGGGIIKACKSK
ncbi:MAG: tRNA-specific 2-thiouridylase [Acidimicrobiales bacterium]|jgi:tRNA-specific 2-thiouridylase